MPVNTTLQQMVANHAQAHYSIVVNDHPNHTHAQCLEIAVDLALRDLVVDLIDSGAAALPRNSSTVVICAAAVAVASENYRHDLFMARVAARERRAALRAGE